MHYPLPVYVVSVTCTLCTYTKLQVSCPQEKANRHWWYLIKLGCQNQRQTAYTVNFYLPIALDDHQPTALQSKATQISLVSVGGYDVVTTQLESFRLIFLQFGVMFELRILLRN